MRFSPHFLHSFQPGSSQCASSPKTVERVFISGSYISYSRHLIKQTEVVDTGGMVCNDDPGEHLKIVDAMDDVK